MCCRFFAPGEDNPEYADFISGLKNTSQIKTGCEVFPRDTVAVLANNRQQAPAPFPMRWGFTEFGKLIFNTRSETAAAKPLFRDGIMNRRCLIPAICYYEWDQDKNKFQIGPVESELIWIAGIYRFEENTPVFSILTRAPSDELRKIHERMPVIIPNKNKFTWLEKEADPDLLIKTSLMNLQFAQT